MDAWGSPQRTKNPQTETVGVPTFLGSQPTDYINSSVARGRVLVLNQWNLLEETEAANFLEVREVLVWPQGAACVFALAFSPEGFGFNVAGGLNQDYVDVVEDIPAQVGSTRVILETALSQKDRIYVYATAVCNYRISGKIATY